jgi:Aerotolerance regulator N-terminal/von Willebrand factor type A domain
LTWAAPLFLYGLILLAIPIIIHYLRRQKPRPMPFSAVMFLYKTHLKRRRRMGFRNFMLLLLRCLAIALLCLLFSRPTFRTAATSVASGKEAANVVVVVDQSLSMATNDRGVVRFERARQRAIATLKALRQEDKAGLVLTSQRTTKLSPALTTDKVSLIRKLEAREPLPVGSNVWSGLEVAGRMLADVPNPEIVLITDMQESAWNADRRPPAPERPIDLHIMDVGHPGTENAALVSLEVDPLRPSPGQPVQFKLGLERYQGKKPEALKLNRRLFNGFQSTSRIRVPATGRDIIELQSTARALSDRVMSFELQSDALQADNLWQFCLDVGPPSPWFVIDGDPTANRGRGSAYYAADALYALGGGRGRVVQSIAISLSEWDSAGLVAVTGVKRWSASQVKRLEMLLHQGGSVLLFLSPDLDQRNWNRLIIKPFFDGSLGPLIEADGKKPAQLGRVDFHHPFFRLWKEHSDQGDPLRLRTGRSYSFIKRPTNGRIAARLVGGDPAIIDTRVGSGRLVLFNLFSDTSKITLFKQPLLISILGEALADMRPDEPRSIAYQVGDNVEVTAFSTGMQSNITVEVSDPLGEIHPLVLTPGTIEGSYQGRWSSTMHPGVYRVSTGGVKDVLRHEPRLFCVNASRKDSDLTCISREVLEPQLTGYRVDWIQNRANATGMLAANRTGRKITHLLLILMTAAWIIETFLNYWGILSPKPLRSNGEVG